MSLHTNTTISMIRHDIAINSYGSTFGSLHRSLHSGFKGRTNTTLRPEDDDDDYQIPLRVSFPRGQKFASKGGSFNKSMAAYVYSDRYVTRLGETAEPEAHNRATSRENAVLSTANTGNCFIFEAGTRCAPPSPRRTMGRDREQKHHVRGEKPLSSSQKPVMKRKANIEELADLDAAHVEAAPKRRKITDLPTDPNCQNLDRLPRFWTQHNSWTSRGARLCKGTWNKTQRWMGVWSSSPRPTTTTNINFDDYHSTHIVRLDDESVRMDGM